MKKKKKYRSLFTSLFSLILVIIFLAPSGLKLEHALIFHSEIEECKHAETHFHTSSNHNDFLDYFFQPVVKSFFKSLKLYKTAIIDKVFDNNYLIFYSKPLKFVGLRGPPLLMYT